MDELRKQLSDLAERLREAGYQDKTDADVAFEAGRHSADLFPIRLLEFWLDRLPVHCDPGIAPPGGSLLEPFTVYLPGVGPVVVRLLNVARLATGMLLTIQLCVDAAGKPLAAGPITTVRLEDVMTEDRLRVEAAARRHPGALQECAWVESK
jgi:hypothetical protein